MWVLFNLNILRLKNPLTVILWSPELFIVNERSGMFPIEDHHVLTKKGITEYMVQQGARSDR